VNAYYRRINATATEKSGCSGLIYQTQTSTPLAKAIVDAYARGEEDEALEPLVLVDKNNQPVGRIKNGDYIIFYDLRGEREIELTRAFTEETFNEFPIQKDLQVNFATLVEYLKGLNVRVAFPPEEELKDTLSEVIGKNGLRQAKIAESEKAMHINYFFNGKRNEPFVNEERIIIPSPKNIPYDQAPEMSITGVTSAIIKKLNDSSCNLIVANFANIDVVGHIENEPAVKKAVEAVDKHIGRVVRAAQKTGVTTIITSDHGTVEKWLYPDGTIDTGHTDSPVPLIVVSSEGLVVREKGELADVAPTVLELLGVAKPELMTAQSLLENTRINADYDTDISGKRRKKRRVLLLILDGWGINDETKGNLIFEAKTPVMDRLQNHYPCARLKAAGEPVGLPEGVVGNSEVGHLHIGAGRRVYSDRLRIDRAIADGSFFKNEVLTRAMDRARQTQAALHLLGIISFYSSHGSLDHLKALLDMAKRKHIKDIFIHAIIGRRGEKPESGARYVAEIETMGIGRVVSVIGRFWALDREENWDRIEKTYRLLVVGTGRSVNT
jgi:2,3-bisphosphoglycerate-independent phosphoglycerate mutase